jgi:hypothetical protein
LALPLVTGVRLEDLTAIQEPKSPEQIIQEEASKEAELLDWVKKTAEWGHKAEGS